MKDKQGEPEFKVAEEKAVVVTDETLSKTFKLAGPEWEANPPESIVEYEETQTVFPVKSINKRSPTLSHTMMMAKLQVSTNTLWPVRASFR